MRSLKDQRRLRARKVRTKLRARSKMPRLIVFRSNKHIYAQIVDDNTAKTLASESDISSEKSKSTQKAKKVGTNLAKKAIAKKITKVVLDRGSYKYHGRIKALAEGAREGGLKF